MAKENDTKTVNINIRVTETTKKELSKLADSDRRSLSDYLRLQIEKIVSTGKKS